MNRADDFAPIEFELKDGEPDPAEIVTKALADIETKVNDRLAAIETKSADTAKVTSRLDKLEARLNRPGASETKADVSIERKAFDGYLRGRTLDAEEQKALSLESPGTGGAIITNETRTTVIQKITEFSPIRSVAGSLTMGGALLTMPRLVDDITVGEVTETQTRPESDPTFEQIDVKPFEMAVIVPVTRIMLEDSSVDLGSFITNHIATQFGKKEAAWFVNGNGTSQAEGVLTNTEVTTRTTGTVGLLADDLIDTFYDLSSSYSARGSWLMNRATMAVVRKLKDGDGQYLWQPSIAAGQPATILGRPVLEAVDMPGPAAGATVAVFGDFGTGYLIVDRVDLQVARDDVTGWGNGIVKFNARRRVGGRVILGEALRKLKIKAA